MGKKKEVELEGLEEQPKRVCHLFGGYVGTFTSPNAGPEAKERALVKLKKLQTLYPEIVVRTGETYEKYLVAAGEMEESESEEAKLARRVELFEAKTWELLVAEKFVQLARSAERRSKEFGLTMADVEKLMKRKTCHYTGVKLKTHLRDAADPNFRTIDRIDPELGYVKGNVVACTHVANQIKNRLFEEPTSSLATNIKMMTRMIEQLNKAGFEGRN